MIKTNMSEQAQADLDECIEAYRISFKLARLTVNALVQARELSLCEAIMFAHEVEKRHEQSKIKR